MLSGIYARRNDHDDGPSEGMSPFDGRVAQLEDAIKKAYRDIKSAEELLYIEENRSHKGCKHAQRCCQHLAASWYGKR